MPRPNGGSAVVLVEAAVVVVTACAMVERAVTPAMTIRVKYLFFIYYLVTLEC